jgi:hypothetical protein
MRKFFLICALGLFSCGLHEWDMPVSESKMVEALQEALFLGSKTAASNLGDSSCEMQECVTGYLGNKLVEILLPDTVKEILDFIDKINSLSSPIKSTLQTVVPQSSSLFGLGKYRDSIKVALNRGAEQAAPASVNVFKDAIFGMSFFDAKEVLLGDSVAATSYLNKRTYSGLQSAFAPILKEPLNQLNVNQYWEYISSKYNSFASAYSISKNNILISSLNLPALPYEAIPEDLSAYLADYATGKALDGLFLMVGKQETNLRADPWGTVSAAGGFISDTVGDLLGDIFTKAKDNLL